MKIICFGKFKTLTFNQHSNDIKVQDFDKYIVLFQPSLYLILIYPFCNCKIKSQSLLYCKRKRKGMIYPKQLKKS